ncbi:MAG: Glu-tRNA(Gln) amidotransferase subunit GatE [Candidatus Nanoarchaeia archaeon]|nr:Glu-tRNA(Gln) amidotransferase subunit GatE [Candidatus Nanoarchaeia archaeon]
MDYKRLGLKVGLEIHQQLDTHKLFCNCPSRIVNEKGYSTITRKLRAVAGELGVIDTAAKFEQQKDKVFKYEVHRDVNCLVDIDEEPPRGLNMDALNIAMQVSLAMNMKPVDELYVMRKTVVDGSNTTGFQRTAMVSTDGFIETSFGKVRVNQMCLEEDAARKLFETENKVVYSLDRLGIPLIELRTEPDMHTPEQVKECAEKIGMFMRMTGRVKRGLGTIRQDVNVSIKGGNRVEIKGAQDLSMIPELVKNESARQLSLLDISKKIKKINPEIVDITDLLVKTEAKFVFDALKENKKVKAICMKGYAGLLGLKIQEQKTFGKEFAYVANLFGLKGVIHSDELPAYGIKSEEKKKIAEKLKCTSMDAFLFVVGYDNIAETCLKSVIERANLFVKGVPKDVRKANDDGTSSYLRPMPGSSRMYPETDLPPVVITNGFLKNIKLPESPEKKFERFTKLYKLSPEQASQIIHSVYLMQFEEFVQHYNKIKASVIADALISTPKELKKKYNLDIKEISDDYYNAVFKLVHEGCVSKKTIVDVIAGMFETGKTAEEVAKKKDLFLLDMNELETIVKETVKKLKTDKINVIMGEVMKQTKGKADGDIVKELVNKYNGGKNGNN